MLERLMCRRGWPWVSSQQGTEALSVRPPETGSCEQPQELGGQTLSQPSLQMRSLQSQHVELAWETPSKRGPARAKPVLFLTETVR